jgi:hypothetical protein
MTPRRIPQETSDDLRGLHDEFLKLLEEKGYAENTIKSYDEYGGNFLRWLEGEFEPPGPRGS